MGRKKSRQPTLFVPHTATQAPGHRFYEKLNELLAKAGFDRFVEQTCERFYDPDVSKGRQSVPPGVYFRMLLIGYFEGIESERGICWRCADSLSLREFLGLNLEDRIPEHSTLSRTRTRLDVLVYDEVFKFVLRIVSEKGLLRGKVVGVDSTYLRADASMKNIVRKDSGESYETYLKGLAEAAGVQSPTAEDARRMDRKRPKKTSNADWASTTDPDARIARLKDGRTRLAYKAEHVTDLETGAILSASMHPANAADTATMMESLDMARENVLSTCSDDDDDDLSSGGGSAVSIEIGALDCPEIVADKGYYKTQLLVDLQDAGFRPYISEPRRPGGRRWKGKSTDLRDAAVQNRVRTKRPKGRAHQRRRGEYLERTFAHVCETGAGRRTRLRGLENATKGYLIRAAAANLGVVLRTLFGVGTPRGWADRLAQFFVRARQRSLLACRDPWLHSASARLLPAAVRDTSACRRGSWYPGAALGLRSPGC